MTGAVVRAAPVAAPWPESIRRLPGPPPWAAAWGDDEFGAWADLEVREVVQRLRWIAAGELWMGSPADETGRLDDEGPRHRVRISRGFWLADTPCTQALWHAMTGQRPSRFKGDEHPVEQVSWSEVQAALARLSRGLPPGFEAALPTEAQWEYTARSGTAGAFNVGDSLSAEQANINGELGGTCPVRRYLPSAWGLYDCHGQVWELCQDGMRDYSESVPGDTTLTDPEGPSGPGARRVVRGGSWLHDPRFARCAVRFAHEPGFRYRYLGFRLALRSTSPAGRDGP